MATATKRRTRGIEIVEVWEKWSVYAGGAYMTYQYALLADGTVAGRHHSSNNVRNVQWTRWRKAHNITPEQVRSLQDFTVVA